MIASNTHRRLNRPAVRVPRALGLGLAIALLPCVWPAIVRAGDAGVQPPVAPQDFDPFDLPQEDTHDPFDEVAWAVPHEDSDYAPPDAPPAALPSAPAVAAPAAAFVPPAVSPRPVARKAQTAEFAHAPSADTAFTQTTQLELLEPADQDQAEGYAQSARDWRPKPLDQLTINIAEPTGLTPQDYAGERPRRQWPCDPTVSRCWPLLTYQWAATCLCYQPLYFEEINLERYGYGCHKCLQPAASAAHFFGTVPILPYCMAVNCPGECNYTLGEYRPGSCAPWRTTCPGPSATGGLSEAAVVVGLVLLIP